MFQKPKRIKTQVQLNRLMTAKEFAVKHNVHIRTVIKWAHQGKVWATKIGNNVYFDPIVPPR